MSQNNSAQSDHQLRLPHADSRCRYSACIKSSGLVHNAVGAALSGHLLAALLFEVRSTDASVTIPSPRISIVPRRGSWAALLFVITSENNIQAMPASAPGRAIMNIGNNLFI